MFGFDRFNLSRFSLGSDESVFHVEHTFADIMNSVAGAAIPVETEVFFTSAMRGSMKGAIAIHSDFASDAVLSSTSTGRANIRIDTTFAEALLHTVHGSQNNNINLELAGVLNMYARAVIEIQWRGDFTAEMHQAVSIVKNLPTSQLVYAVLNAMAGAIRQATEAVSVTITIPPGGELRIDSDTFRVLLNGENILYAQHGDWITLSRELLAIDIESASGGELSGNLIYTERYL